MLDRRRVTETARILQLEAELGALRLRVAELEGEAAVSGWVIDAGGGQVGIMVARDTTEYPPVGCEVQVRVVSDGERT